MLLMRHTPLRWARGPWVPESSPVLDQHDNERMFVGFSEWVSLILAKSDQMPIAWYVPASHSVVAAAVSIRIEKLRRKEVAKNGH